MFDHRFFHFFHFASFIGPKRIYFNGGCRLLLYCDYKWQKICYYTYLDFPPAYSPSHFGLLWFWELFCWGLSWRITDYWWNRRNRKIKFDEKQQARSLFAKSYSKIRMCSKWMAARNFKAVCHFVNFILFSEIILKLQPFWLNTLLNQLWQYAKAVQAIFWNIGILEKTQHSSEKMLLFSQVVQGRINGLCWFNSYQ